MNLSLHGFLSLRNHRNSMVVGRGCKCQDVTAIRTVEFGRGCSRLRGSELLKCAPGELCFSERLYQPEVCWTH